LEERVLRECHNFRFFLGRNVLFSALEITICRGEGRNGQVNEPRPARLERLRGALRVGFPVPAILIVSDGERTCARSFAVGSI
jgi:hypothetical protein